MMVYAKEMCMKWDPKREKHRPSKARKKKEMQTIVLYSSLQFFCY